ncbi:hypothetical protein BGX29_003238, partial [Mortierella sp. GBA35]
MSTSPLPTSQRTVTLLWEVIDLVGSFLHSLYLFVCIQLSRSWHHSLVPRLWSVANDLSYSWPKLLKTTDSAEPWTQADDERIRRLFLKYGHHIHELHATNPAFIAAASSAGTSTTTAATSGSGATTIALAYLRGPPPTEPGSWTPITGATIGGLDSGSTYLAPSPTEQGFATASALQGSFRTGSRVFMVFGYQSIYTAGPGGARYSPILLELDKCLCALPKLWTIRTALTLIGRQYFQGVYSQLLDLNLNLLTVPCPTVLVLLKYLPELVSLSIGGVASCGRSVADVKSFPEGIPTSKIQKLSFNPSAETAKAVGKHCRNLKVFRQGYDGYTLHPVDGAQFLILGIERLTPEEEIVMDALVDSRRYHLESKDWDSLLLSGDEGDVVAKFQRSREQQQETCGWIGQLTSLKTLNFGYEHRNVRLPEWDEPPVYEVDGIEYIQYGGLIPNTLELLVDSGLDRLSALKDLEVFGFEGCDHRIGKRELDLMASRWPKLKVMHGLQEDMLGQIEFDRHKAELREYMKRLRPDVTH